MGGELVSVIIPTYNRADLIGETLESVLAQTYRPIEILVVDDGSTDDTESVVRSYEAKLTEGLALRYLRQEHSGAPTARNRGLADSGGDFIQFLDSDDTIAPGKLRAQVAALAAKPSVSVAYGPWRCEYLGRKRRLGPKQQEAPQESEDSMLRGYLSGRWYLPLHGYLFSRAAVVAVGPWDETLLRGQDADYMIRCLLSGSRFVYVPGSEVLYRRHPGEHIGHPAAFARHFESRLSLIHKQHNLLTESGRWECYSKEIALVLTGLEDAAAVMGHAAGGRACREEMARIFGNDRPAVARRSLRRSISILMRRYIARPLKRVFGEAFVARLKSLVERIL